MFSSFLVTCFVYSIKSECISTSAIGNKVSGDSFKTLVMEVPCKQNLAWKKSG